MSEQRWPAWRYGPGGKGAVFESPDDVPSGWEDHPSKVGAKGDAGGTKTAVTSANGPHISEAGAAATTDAKSQTHVDPVVAAQSGVSGAGVSPPAGATAPAAGGTDAEKPELDANGHPWSADLYAPTKTKTGAGLWRMKVGKSRPAPVAGYPLDL